MLERVAKQLVRFGERVRIRALCKRLDASPLPPEVTKPVKDSLAIADAAKADFAAALARAAEVELNRRNVGGAEHEHFLNLALSGAELVNAHLLTVEKIDELILAWAERKPEKPSAASVQPGPKAEGTP